MKKCAEWVTGCGAPRGVFVAGPTHAVAGASVAGYAEYGPDFHGPAGAYGAHLGYAMGPGFMAYGMWLGGLLWLFFLVALVAVVVLVVRAIVLNRLHPPGKPTEQREAALRILDERYARGEIKREEYLEKRRDLDR